MHEESIRSEFTHQSESFARAAATGFAETLAAIVELVPVDPGASWVEVACGPAAIARAMAPRVGRVRGIDLTPAMIAKASEEARRAGLTNIELSLGDATALEFQDGSFDGAVTRLSLHHIPAPQRVLSEMARVVRPGGWVIVSDILGDEDRDAAAWHEEVERLRDPSHWAFLTAARLRALGRAAGLELETERPIPLDLDYEDWLARGSGGASAGGLIDGLLDEAPPLVRSFRVSGEAGRRRLALQGTIVRWRRP